MNPHLLVFASIVPFGQVLAEVESQRAKVTFQAALPARSSTLVKPSPVGQYARARDLARRLERLCADQSAVRARRAVAVSMEVRRDTDTCFNTLAVRFRVRIILAVKVGCTSVLPCVSVHLCISGCIRHFSVYLGCFGQKSALCACSGRHRRGNSST